MRNIYITKGGSVGAQVAPDLTITIHGRPLDTASLGESATFYDEESTILAEALWATLPGGTLDRLMVKLFQTRMSLFVIPFGGE